MSCEAIKAEPTEPVTYRDNRHRMSQSGVNRLSVTRSLVQRLGQAEEVYGKTSKAGTPSSPRKNSDKESPEQEVKVIVTPEPAEEQRASTIVNMKESSVVNTFEEIKEVAIHEDQTEVEEEEDHVATPDVTIIEVKADGVDSKEDDVLRSNVRDQADEDIRSEEAESEDVKSQTSGSKEDHSEDNKSDEEDKVEKQVQKTTWTDDEPKARSYTTKKPVFDRPRVRIGAGSYRSYGKTSHEHDDSEENTKPIQRRANRKLRDSNSDSD